MNLYSTTKVILLSLMVVTSIQSQSIHKEIENIILFDTDISYELTPGFIIGIVDGDSTYIETYGASARDRRKELDFNDIFEIGSITKLFTALLIDIAENENLLSSKDKLNSYLTIDYKNPRLNDLSLENLVNHQSGLPKRPYGFGAKEVDPQNPYKYYSKQDLLTSYSKFVVEDGSVVYSHMNYALLEVVLETVYNKPYFEILEEKILLPLGMNSTLVRFKEDKEILTAGLDRSGTKVTPWQFSSFEGSEGMKSTIGDMIKFMRANLGLDNSEISVIAQNNFDNKNPSFNENIVVSSGWQILKINKRMNAAIHTGSTSGHSAFIGLVKETGTGVVVLSNSTFGTKDLGLLVLRMVNQNWKRKPN